MVVCVCDSTKKGLFFLLVPIPGKPVRLAGCCRLNSLTLQISFPQTTPPTFFSPAMNSGTTISLQELKNFGSLAECFELSAAWLPDLLNLLDRAKVVRVTLCEGAYLTTVNPTCNTWHLHSPEGQILLLFTCFSNYLRVEKAFTNLLIYSEDELMDFLLVCDPAETDAKGSSPGSVTLPDTSDDASAATPRVLDLKSDQLLSLALMEPSNFPILDGKVSVAITKKEEERRTTTATHVRFAWLSKISFKDCDGLTCSLSIYAELAVPMPGTKTFQQESTGHCVFLLGVSPSVNLGQYLSILLSRVSVTSSNTHGTLCRSDPLYESESDSDESSESESESGPMLSATRAVGPPADARDSTKKSFY